MGGGTTTSRARPASSVRPSVSQSSSSSSPANPSPGRGAHAHNNNDNMAAVSNIHSPWITHLNCVALIGMHWDDGCSGIRHRHDRAAWSRVLSFHYYY